MKKDVVRFFMLIVSFDQWVMVQGGFAERNQGNEGRKISNFLVQLVYILSFWMWREGGEGGGTVGKIFSLGLLGSV